MERSGSHHIHTKVRQRAGLRGQQQSRPPVQASLLPAAPLVTGADCRVRERGVGRQPARWDRACKKSRNVQLRWRRQRFQATGWADGFPTGAQRASHRLAPSTHPISSTASNTSSALRQAPSLLSLLTSLVRPGGRGQGKGRGGCVGATSWQEVGRVGGEQAPEPTHSQTRSWALHSVYNSPPAPQIQFGCSIPSRTTCLAGVA